ncbi:MAG: hypothetical protein QM500_18150 [Methylococcales bacterium]
MEKTMLRTLYNEGVLSSACVIPSPCNGNSYQLEFTRLNGLLVVMTVQNKKRAKLFKFLETAIRNARDVGFKDITVKLN